MEEWDGSDPNNALALLYDPIAVPGVPLKQIWKAQPSS